MSLFRLSRQTLPGPRPWLSVDARLKSSRYFESRASITYSFCLISLYRPFVSCSESAFSVGIGDFSHVFYWTNSCHLHLAGVVARVGVGSRSGGETRGLTHLGQPRGALSITRYRSGDGGLSTPPAADSSSGQCRVAMRRLGCPSPTHLAVGKK